MRLFRVFSPEQPQNRAVVPVGTGGSWLAFPGRGWQKASRRQAGVNSLANFRVLISRRGQFPRLLEPGHERRVGRVLQRGLQDLQHLGGVVGQQGLGPQA